MDYYQLLDIPRAASPEDIENRYHVLAKKYHPDRSRSPDAHEKFIKIKEAYDILKNPLKKKAYDASLPPEEKAMEASSEPEVPEVASSPSSSDQDSPEKGSSTSQFPEQPVSGPNGFFKPPSISYVSFKSDHNSYPSSPTSLSETKVESGKSDGSEYVSSEKGPNLRDRFKEIPKNTGQKDADWSSVKVKYEGMDDNTDDDSGKTSKFSAGLFLKKAFRFTFVLICIFLVLIVVSPDLVGAQASGFGAVTETFNKVIFLVKSLV